MVIQIDLDKMNTANSHSDNIQPYAVAAEKVVRGTEITASEPDEESLTHNNIISGRGSKQEMGLSPVVDLPRQ